MDHKEKEEEGSESLNLVNAVKMKNIPKILRLLGAEKITFLQRCKTLREICDILFYVDSPSEKLHLMKEHVKPTKALHDYEEGWKKVEKRAIGIGSLMAGIVTKRKIPIPTFSNEKDRMEFLEKQCLLAPLTLVKEVLEEASPLFKHLWRSADQHKTPLQLFDGTREAISSKTYSTRDRSITLGPHKSFERLLRSLIHGTFDALHHDTLGYLIDTPIQREIYTVIRVYMDYQTNHYLNRIFVILFNDKMAPFMGFKSHWQNSEKDGKANLFRSIWDGVYFCDFIAENPAFVNERVTLLSKI